MSLSVPPVSSTPVRVPEAAEGRGPDRDGDADDMATAAATPVKAAAPAGQGTLVDKIA